MATQGYFRNPETEEVIDLAGLAVGTVVRDNGVSENDPADQISYSVFELDEPFAVSTEKPDYPLFDVTQRQVEVKSEHTLYAKGSDCIHGCIIPLLSRETYIHSEFYPLYT